MKSTVAIALSLMVTAFAQAADFYCVREAQDHSVSTIAAVEQALGTTLPASACTTVLLDGPIVSGDTDRLKDIFARSEGVLERVNLNSHGGDLREAMAMGRFIRTALLATASPLKWGTIKPFYPPIDFPTWNPCGEAECGCASACFAIWAAGINRTGHLLSVHRPRFESEYFAGLDIASAQREYGLALMELERYFQEMDIPSTYYERMVNTPSSDLRALTNEEAEELWMDSYPPAIDEWLASRCGAFSKAELDAMLEYGRQQGGKQPTTLTADEHKTLLDKWGEVTQCRAKTILQTRREVFEKLISSPRPQRRYIISDNPLDLEP